MVKKVVNTNTNESKLKEIKEKRYDIKKRSNSRKRIIRKVMGIEIRKKRISLGITQIDLSEMSEVQRMQICSIENGNSGLTIFNLIKIYESLDMKLDLTHLDFSDPEYTMKESSDPEYTMKES